LYSKTKAESGDSAKEAERDYWQSAAATPHCHAAPPERSEGMATTTGWRGRGKDRLNQSPMFFGEVHRIFE
jgi:hypothetical protein